MKQKKLIIFMPSIEGGGVEKNLFIISNKILKSKMSDRSSVSLRAVITGLIFVFAISLISPYAVLMVKGSQLTSNAIPIIAITLLFFLTVVALPLLRLLQSRWMFEQGELITIYVMMVNLALK